MCIAGFRLSCPSRARALKISFASGNQSWPVQMYVVHQCNLGFMITETDMGTMALTARIGI